jgi:voltage-gated potassium channel
VSGLRQGLRTAPGRSDERDSAKQVLVALGALATLTLTGTLGFWWIEDLSFLDALYMAVITLSTVGYQEVAPITQAGRIYTVIFILVGVGTAFYAVVTLAAFLLEGRLRSILGRTAMNRQIQSLSGHVVVCGFGRLGRSVASELALAGTQVVVIEQNPDLEPELAAAGHPYVLGSATDDGVLSAAGVENAQAIVAATSGDADNVFIALSARELNPGISLHARAESDGGMRRLRLAGADQVVSLHRLGGQRIANAIVRPAVTDFIELATPGGDAPIDLEEVRIAPNSALVDVPMGELSSHGLRVSVVAVKREGAATRLHPHDDEVIGSDDRVVVVGDRENLKRLAELANAASR